MSIEQVAGMEEQRDVLLRSLRDLEEERAAGEIADDDYATLKEDYTARAAAVLRAIEAGRAAAGPRRAAPGRSAPVRRRNAASAATATRSPRPAPRQRSLVVTLGVVFVIVALAGGSLALFAGGRNPGQPATGSVPGSPSDLVSQALSLESDGKAVDALKLYDQVLADDPGNAPALAYRGWLLKRAGLADEALASLDRAVAADPTFADAHFFRGMVLYQDKDDPAGAVAEFEAFLANNPPPDFVASVQQVLAEAKDAAEAKAGGPAPTSPDPAPALG